jgi:uncharacterized protein (TIGR04255 family)
MRWSHCDAKMHPKSNNESESALMAERHYRNAPITEALIDLQVEFINVPPQSRFVEVAQALSDQFPTSSVMRQFEMNIGDVEADGRPMVKSDAEVGMRLTSSGQDRILQIQQRGFTYSHLPPYTQWASFCAEAKELWARFVQEFAPIAVTRAAVRYINRIVVPANAAKFDEYFTLYPKVPEGITDPLTGCFVQMVLPQPNVAEQAAAVINFALEPAQAPGSLSFLLDFDLFSTCRLPPDSDDVWAMLERLRTRKNELFEASITDVTRDLFI